MVPSVRVYQTLEAGLRDVPTPSLSPLVQVAAAPGEPGGSAVSATAGLRPSAETATARAVALQADLRRCFIALLGVSAGIVRPEDPQKPLSQTVDGVY